MHLVSPVRIRVESGITNPMTTTNFEDAINKSKKRVQIGSSTFFKENVKPIQPSAKPIKRTIYTGIKNRQLTKKKPETYTNKYERVAIKDQKSLKHQPIKPIPVINKNRTSTSCSTCIESRSRSRNGSKTPDYKMIRVESSFEESSMSCSQGNTSSSSCTFHDSYEKPMSPKRRVFSLSPIRSALHDAESLNRMNSNPCLCAPHSNSNLTYTMMSNRSRSYDSPLKEPCSHIVHHHEPIPIKLTNRESLCKKLALTESTVNELTHQLTMLRDYLVSNNPHQFLNQHSIGHIQNEKEKLVVNLEMLELNNMELKEALHSMSVSSSMSNPKLIEENEMFAQKCDDLEIEKNNYKNMLMDLETNIYKADNTNEALNLENNALANLKMSLEENRAHLRRQLISKESEINRLSVQTKDLGLKLNKAQMEIDLLKKGRYSSIKQQSKPLTVIEQKPLVGSKKSNTNIYNHNNNARLVKQYFNLEEVLNDPHKVKLYVDKLNSQIAEKDNSLKLVSDKLEKLSQFHMENEFKKNQQQENVKNKVKSNGKNRNNVNSNDSDERTVTTSSSSTSNNIRSISTEQKSIRAEKHQAEQLRKENDKLKTHIKVKEDKLKKAESKIKSLEQKLNKPQSSINQYNSHQNKSNSKTQQSEVTTGAQSSDDATTNIPTYNSQSIHTNQNISNESNNNIHNDSYRQHFESANETSNLEVNSIQRNKNFNQQELNNVRSRLQERLNELEPLPELLKNTELKLHDALIKLKNFEIESLENKRTINELKYEIDTAHVNNNNLLEKFKESSSIKSRKNPSQVSMTKMNESLELKNMEESTKRKLIENLKSSKLEPIEKRIQMLEEDNQELHRQITVKEESIRELSSKLAVKSNEASSYSRQLEMAMTDLKLKEQQHKEKHHSNERHWVTKCSELESKLSSLQFFNKTDKRDKEEMTSDLSIQVKDLKARLEQAQTSNKQMQDYVNFLKNSYMSYFNENTFDNFEYGNSSLYGIH